MEASPLEFAGSIVYHVDAADTLVAFGGDWDRFVEENGAPELTAGAVRGRSIYDFVSDPATRHVLAMLLERVRKTGEEARYDFRCDAPGLRRFMRMDVKPLPDGGLAFHSTVLRVEPRPPIALLDRELDRSDELITMCGWCKRVLWSGIWVDVEDFLGASGLMEAARLPRPSHGMCPDCREDMMRAIQGAPAR